MLEAVLKMAGLAHVDVVLETVQKDGAAFPAAPPRQDIEIVLEAT